MTMRGRLVFLDTNVLLSATNRTRPEHNAAQGLFAGAARAGCHLALSGQILREYLVVATRPSEANGLGMSLSDALANVRWFRSQAVFLEEEEAVFDGFLTVVQESGCTGKQIHDANVAAVAAFRGADVIVTQNSDDFRRYPDVTCLSIEEAVAAMVKDADEEDER